ncbi:hypothetical protein [Chitinophaga pinensis]|uniref:Uncharacterized protein n=1 Tax=Chitinophaga pinensis TaxID=79329 RepID=A0A5C6LR00_9BACT|nr:hypothetical protein [Chitinophaga pinensis]TWV96215.1 hypothetical protein FEF09_23835 [Chitinophaga pinensis]
MQPESISQEYINKSYNEPTDEFPEGKWRPVPITVSKGLSGGGYEYEVTTPSGKKHKRLFAYPYDSYEKLLQKEESISVKTMMAYLKELYTILKAKDSQPVTTGTM